MFDGAILIGVVTLTAAAGFALGLWCGLGRAASRWDAGYAAAIDDKSSQNDLHESAKTVYCNEQIDRPAAEAMVTKLRRWVAVDDPFNTAHAAADTITQFVTACEAEKARADEAERKAALACAAHGANARVRRRIRRINNFNSDAAENALSKKLQVARAERDEAREALAKCKHNQAIEISFTYSPTGERVRIFAANRRAFEILAKIVDSAPKALSEMFRPRSAIKIDDIDRELSGNKRPAP